uniref:ATP-binding cassette domain-containing protein n=1 Tax=Photobacterium sanctipauli TaxID=1342794 RepID=UPI000567D855
LGDKGDHYPAALSGGQQQRVGIGRAMALEAELLLFDEPTSALDPEWVGEVLTLMQKLATRHQTMLVVTHEMQFAREVADRGIFMADGEFVEQGTPEQIFNHAQDPRLKKFLNKVGIREGSLHSATQEV